MNARSTAARLPEPTTLAEMHARKREADARQAAAAQRLQRQSPADRARVEQFKRQVDAETQVEASAPAQPHSEPPSAAPEIDPLTDAQIRQTLGDDRIERTPRRIITRVAEEYGLRYDDIVGESREGPVVEARFAAIAAVRSAHPKRSLPWLGTQFGNRDHTTILHALRHLGLAAPAAPNAVLAGLAVDSSGMRPVAPLALPDLQVAPAPGPSPTFRFVDPCSLRIDPAYQRGLSEKSLNLIRRIVGNWSWSAFKPPIVVEGDGGLDVIDGQHTAIAAATHPDISEIPVMVVVAERREERADAFVRHNRDRVQVTGMQMHVSLVAAGDQVANGVEQACRAAGARVLRVNPTAGRYAVGDTMAVEVLGRLVKRHGVEKAAEVVRTCVEAELAPVTATALRAVETLLLGTEHAGLYAPDALARTFRALGSKLDRDAAIFSATNKAARWQGFVAVLARNTRRVRADAASGEGRL